MIYRCRNLKELVYYLRDNFPGQLFDIYPNTPNPAYYVAVPKS